MGHVNAYIATGSRVIVTAHVRHSQSVTQAQLRPWFAAEKSGTIICAHCSCMVGLGETCSHISALLFAAEAHTRLVRNTACTSLPCGWLPPTMQSVTYKAISEIDFTAPKTKQNKMIEGKKSTTSKSYNVPLPCDDEIKVFYEQLSKADKPSLLSIVPGYSEKYVLKDDYVPTPFTDLFQYHYFKMPYTDLISECELVFNSLKITSAQAKKIEALTRDQAGSKHWFRYRAGRVTASKFKAAARTNQVRPTT